MKERLQRLPGCVLWLMRVIFIKPLRGYFRYVPWIWGKGTVWNWTAAHLWWLESEVSCRTVFGAKLWVDAEDIVGKYIYYFGVWEPNLTNWMVQRLKPGDVFIDVGANVGYFSALASILVGHSGKVVSIEALPQTFDRLAKNLEMNGARNVRLVNVAVWNREEKLRLYTHRVHPSGTTSLIPAWAEQWGLETAVDVSAKPLPCILRSEEISKARLIKIDVEGAEWNVISGMADMLPDTRHDLEIMVEISRSMLKEQGKTGQDLLELFAGHGFHPYQLSNDYSAAAYIAPPTPGMPRRVERILEGAEDQMDVIFSRTDSAFLSTACSGQSAHNNVGV